MIKFHFTFLREGIAVTVDYGAEFITIAIQDAI